MKNYKRKVVLELVFETKTSANVPSNTYLCRFASSVPTDIPTSPRITHTLSGKTTSLVKGKKLEEKNNIHPWAQPLLAIG